MKTFADLIFNDSGGILGAKLKLKNGYGVSVITGKHVAGGTQGFFELAVLDHHDLIIPFFNGNDVNVWLTPADVTHLIPMVQERPILAVLGDVEPFKYDLIANFLVLDLGLLQDD